MRSVDSEATRCMLQLLLLDRTTRYLYFFMHHCPLAASRPRWRWQRDPFPSGAIPMLPPKDGAKPSQSGLYPPFNLILFFSCCWAHVLSLCSSFHHFFFFWFFFNGRGLMQGEKTKAEKPHARPVLYNLSWDAKRQKLKPKKTKQNKWKTNGKTEGKKKKSVHDSWSVVTCLAQVNPVPSYLEMQLCFHFFLNSYTSMILLHCS